MIKNRLYKFSAAVALVMAAVLQSRAVTSFDVIDLSPCRKAGAFADAVWKDALRDKEDFSFHGVPFRLMKPENTADPSFALDLEPATYAEAAVLFCVDEANASALPYMALRFSAGGRTGDAAVDLRGGDGPTLFVKK